MTSRRLACISLLFVAFVLPGCARFGQPGARLQRKGDEIMVAGQLFHTGTRVVLWTDSGGYDAYRVERRFSPLEDADWKTSAAQNKHLTSPNRYGLRRSVLSDAEAGQVRGGGWPLELLQDKVDQFVIHFDVCGTSRQCFKVLQDVRDLSVHFMLDADGTIYQTLDLKERAWHASSANSRSIGIEIANIGAYPSPDNRLLEKWYYSNDLGETYLYIPPDLRPSGILRSNLVLQPARNEPVIGTIQNQKLAQYDFTPEQYDALIKLTATLCKVFPKLKCQYPTDPQGELIPHKLSNQELEEYHGLLGHYHVQSNKTDPGPAFQWDKVITGARKILH